MLNRYKFLILAILTVATVPSARAIEAYLGAGVLFQNLLTTTTSSSGSASLTGTLYLPSLQLSATLPMGGSGSGWGLAPSIYYTPLGKIQSDEVTKRLLIAQIPLYFAFNDKLNWKLGPGFQSYSVSGDGGAVTMNNGTGTAVFYRPNGSVTSTTLLIAAGISWVMDESWKLDVDVFVPGFLTTRRAYTLGLSLNWEFL